MGFLPSRNPTKLRVGAKGSLEGRAYTVLGRVVLSTVDGYKWQEYRLRSADSQEVTLVYESGDWKFFRLIEPAAPLTAREAALVRADDTLTIGGRSVAVSYVGKSRVAFIEGAAPEGMKLGDRASYFNAERAVGGMMVVSWTGEEMEFYEGHGLSDREVARGFGLPRPNFFIRLAEDFRRLELDFGQVFLGGLVLVFLFFQFIDYIPDRDPVFLEPPSKKAAPAGRLFLHALGHLGTHDYRVTGHALLEIARPGKKFGRHEYALADETGMTALLVQGPDGNPGEWQLLIPAGHKDGFTPYEAARVPLGRVTTADGRPAETMVFLLQVEQLDGESASWPARLQYGFTALSPGQWLQARWTEQTVQLYTGQRLSTAEVAAAFHAPALLSN